MLYTLKYRLDKGKLFKDFDLVFVAHYHDRITLGENIHYIGSSRQHNFGEDVKKGYVLLNSDSSFSYIDNQVNVKYITFREKYEDIDKNFFLEIRDTANEGYKVKVIIDCTTAQKSLLNKKDFVEAGASKVEFKDEKIKDKSASTASITSRFNKDGLKTAYVDFCEDKDNADPGFGLGYIDLIEIN